jgi:hypothetical protein
MLIVVSAGVAVFLVLQACRWCRSSFRARLRARFCSLCYLFSVTYSSTSRLYVVYPCLLSTLDQDNERGTTGPSR